MTNPNEQENKKTKVLIVDDGTFNVRGVAQALLNSLETGYEVVVSNPEEAFLLENHKTLELRAKAIALSDKAYQCVSPQNSQPWYRKYSRRKF